MWERQVHRENIMKETNGNGLLRRLPSLITLKEPSSVISEQYRILLTRLLQIQKKRPFKIIGVTSAVQGEGKTTVAFNLAITAARMFQKRTLLMEVDVKKPSFPGLITSGSRSGLLDALRGKEDPLTLFQYTMNGQLAILPAGPLTGPTNSIFTSERIQGVLERVQDQFDFIIMDACPVLPLADMNILSEVMESILFVVQADRTPGSFVTKALSLLPRDKIMGLVFNNLKAVSPFSYYYATSLNKYRR